MQVAGDKGKEVAVKLVVAVKQVPDTEASIRIAPGEAKIDLSGVNMILNPYDEYAVEEALKLRDAHGGEVWAVTVGPDSAVDVLRTAIAMGVNDAVHIKAAEGLDPFATATLLAEQIKKMDADLVLLGKMAIDDAQMMVGPMLAELLGVPVVTRVSRLEVADGRLKAERDVEGGHETLEAPLPAVVTAEKGLNEPRYPSLKGKMMAKKKVIETIEAGEVEKRETVVGLNYPPSRSGTKILGEGVDAVPELVRIIRDELKLV